MGVSRLCVKVREKNRIVSSVSPPLLCLPRSRHGHPQAGWTVNHPPPYSRLSFSFLSASLFFFLPTVILEKPIRIPRSLSVKAASVLKGFLNKVRAMHSPSILCLLMRVHCCSVTLLCVGPWPRTLVLLCLFCSKCLSVCLTIK